MRTTSLTPVAISCNTTGILAIPESPESMVALLFLSKTICPDTVAILSLLCDYKICVHNILFFKTLLCDILSL